MIYGLGELYNFPIQVELYSGVFSSLSSSSLTVSAQYGGPVLSLDRGTVTILSSSGEQISAWRWNNKKAVAAGWSDKEEGLFVLEEGIVVIYSMFGILQSSFTMGQEAQDVKLLTGRVFSTHSGTGVAVLTSTHRYDQKNCIQIDASQLPQVLHSGVNKRASRAEDVRLRSASKLELLGTVCARSSVQAAGWQGSRSPSSFPQ